MGKDEVLMFPSGVYEHYHIGWVDEPAGVEIQHWKSGWVVIDSWYLIGGLRRLKEIAKFDTYEEAVAFVKQRIKTIYGDIELFDIPLPTTKKEDSQ